MEYTTVKSTIYFLEMDSRPIKVKLVKENTSIDKLIGKIDVEWYRKLYLSVGEQLNWLERIFMSDDELYEKINSDKTYIYTFKIDDKPAGYCELIENDKDIEILYFGLTPDFIGMGYGNFFLNKTIELAWSYNPISVILNTCDLDHPNAINTYKKAGFKCYKTCIEEKKVKKPL